MMGRSLIVGAACAILASAVTATATDPLAFLQLGNGRSAAHLDARTDHVRRSDDRARIKAANAAAAARHGVPVEFMDRLTMRESGFRFVRGPMTPWGRAHGPHQILCSTAASLGEPDCNRLMRDAERSADLSARYVRMGFDATGSWKGAAAHYHGGPNTRMWGHKTRAYAAAVGGQFPRTVSAYAPPQGSFGVTILPAGFVPASFTTASN
jgi:hypothetical protein